MSNVKMAKQCLLFSYCNRASHNYSGCLIKNVPISLLVVSPRIQMPLEVCKSINVYLELRFMLCSVRD